MIVTVNTSIILLYKLMNRQIQSFTFLHLYSTDISKDLSHLNEQAIEEGGIH